MGLGAAMEPGVSPGHRRIFSVESGISADQNWSGVGECGRSQALTSCRNEGMTKGPIDDNSKAG